MTHNGSNHGPHHGPQSPQTPGSVPLSGSPRLSPGELPVVEGGGIPDTENEPGGISELEAAAMLADFGDPPPAALSPPPRAATPEPIPMALADAHADGHADAHDASTIPPAHEGDARFRAIGVKAKRHEDNWNRTPNATGQGAIHVRTFMSKLTEDGFHALDTRVNEWLDAHPQYEVKFVNTSIGTVTGKVKEAQLICQIWV